MTPYTGETPPGDPITSDAAEPAAGEADAPTALYRAASKTVTPPAQMTATTAPAARWAPPMSRIPMTAQVSRGLTASRMPRDRERRAGRQLPESADSVPLDQHWLCRTVRSTPRPRNVRCLTVADQEPVRWWPWFCPEPIGRTKLGKRPQLPPS